MQRIFTIEVRVDYNDEEKIPVFRKIIQQAGRHIYGQSALLGDGVKPEIIIHSHDYYLGHQDIALFDDDVLSGATAVEEASLGRAAKTAAGKPDVGKSRGFADELLSELNK